MKDKSYFMNLICSSTKLALGSCSVISKIMNEYRNKMKDDDTMQEGICISGCLSCCRMPAIGILNLDFKISKKKGIARENKTSSLLISNFQ